MKPFHIIVLIKQVPDPEGPADAFKVDPEAKKVTPVGIPPVINPYDENALEAALKIKERHGATVTALSMGEKLAQPVLKKALAAGADELLLLIDPLFGDLDNRSTAYVLSTAIGKMGTYDLILTGRQAADWDFGVTGLYLAEALRIPAVNVVQKVEVGDGTVLAERMCDDGHDVVKTFLPCLLTVSSEVGELRYIPVRSLQAVSKRPAKVLNSKDLEVDAERLTSRKINKLIPFQGERQCHFIEGESPREKGEKLALKMKEDRIL